MYQEVHRGTISGVQDCEVQEFQLILYEIEAEGINLPETFQVVTIVEKFPPAWRDFKN